MSQATLGSTPYRNSDLFSGYYLEERVDDLDAWDCDEEAAAVFEELRELWEGEGSLVASYNEDTLLGAWIDPVLDALGYDTIQETSLPDTGGYIDRVLYSDAAERRDAMMMKQDGHLNGTFGKASALLEAKQWDADFSARFSEQRAYRDASHQVKYYLEHTPDSLQWGILTNGRKWRLYGTKNYATETYYEVDLPAILESGDLERFKYFYLFFRPEAFREVSGSSFLETVWSESERAAQELGEDLQDNVFTALRVLGEGFVETNDLDIGEGDGQISTAELKEQSLVLLYRLMFVLYAESRHLIDPDNQANREEYRENFSLDEQRLEIHEQIEDGEQFTDYSEHSRKIWARLQDLFRLVDSGEDSLDISAYNGGLFDREEHAFLSKHVVSDRYIAEVIYRLGTTETTDGSFALADYADLDTRHLGTIYEGLLEHEFRIASEDYAAVAEDGGQVWKPATEVSVADAIETVAAGELYVVNDDGERKATGAYYTPDYVVSYIVEETVDPLLDDIEADLAEQGLERGTQAYVVAFWEGVTDLRVLDPAMGSGHFLTSATEYLGGAVMERVRELETATLFDEQQIRREISRECIYGVDLNGMAVELAKLSMWLETLATDQPLAFLDHHLKAGNSLVGSDISEVLANDDTEVGDGQLTFADVFAQTRQRALEHVMELVEDLLDIDNETIEDAKAMEELYEEIRSDDLYERLFGMANVHTAERFGLDVPGDAYERMARAVDDDGAWAEIEGIDWYTTAQVMAADEQFFHWELEFPEVFFSRDGEREEGGGFDAVVGNPPYVRIYGDSLADDFVDYLREVYPTAHMKFDLYVVFSELGIDLTRDQGTFSYIIPDKFTSTPYGEPFREKILSETNILSILDLRDRSVFEDATVSNVIPILQKDVRGSDRLEIRKWRGAGYESKAELDIAAVVTEDDSTFRLSRTVDDLRLTQKVRNDSIRFDKIFYTNWGLRTGTKEKTEKFVVDEPIDERAHPMLRGQDILGPYRLEEPSEYIIYEKSELYNPMFEELFESDKIIFRKISGSGLMAVADEEENYCFSTLIPCVNIQDVQGVDRSGIPEETQESKKYQNLYYALAVVNSSLLEWFYSVNLSDDLSVVPGHINELPIASLSKISNPDDQRAPDHGQEDARKTIEGKKSMDAFFSDHLEAISQRGKVAHDLLAHLGQEQMKQNDDQLSLNLSLPDHLGAYDDSQTLSDIGFTQPPENAADSILQQTTEEKPNLRVGDAEIVRESPTTVEIRLSARYKPEDEDAYETDQWGYTETDPLPALRITDLTETEADLIEAFVPVAVDEAGGFADFRETATKTNSLVDRLRGLTLPRVDDVAEGLASYIETKERADELDEKIQRTDDLIDEIVYELYGLTDEEIEIVEESVGT